MPTPAQIRALLTAHRTALETAISMNAQANVRPAQRRILDALDDEARRYLRLIEKHEKEPSSGFRWSTLGTLGPNGHGPAIADICKRAEYHRVAGAQTIARAA